MKKLIKDQKGITLVALTIAVIALIILATVFIATLTGDNSIINRSLEAKEQSTREQTKEKIILATTSALKKGLGIITEANLKEELNMIFEEENYTIESNSYGWTVKFEENSFNISEDGDVE